GVAGDGDGAVVLAVDGHVDVAGLLAVHVHAEVARLHVRGGPCGRTKGQGRGRDDEPPAGRAQARTATLATDHLGFLRTGERGVARPTGAATPWGRVITAARRRAKRSLKRRGAGRGVTGRAIPASFP